MKQKHSYCVYLVLADSYHHRTVLNVGEVAIHQGHRFAQTTSAMVVIYANGFGLGEGGEFNHKSLIER
jgi:hypothetical protein